MDLFLLKAEAAREIEAKTSSPLISGGPPAFEAKLLADSGEYVLGIAREKSDPARVERCHQAFVELVRTCAESTNEPSVNAIRIFLEGLNLQALPLPEAFDPAYNLTFRVEGTMPIDLPLVRSFWATTATAQGGRCIRASPPLLCSA